jgi:orotate phosphoribosyltransferase
LPALSPTKEFSLLLSFSYYFCSKTSGMVYTEETAVTVADFLLQIKAVKLNSSSPFKWASGLKSPIYCDNRITLSFPKVRTYMRQEFVKAIVQEFGDVDLIAGVATGGIPQGALIAQELGLPFVYVRAQSKAHGLENKIEGITKSGQSVVVVEDLVSTGKSSLSAVTALRQAGCIVKGMVAIFTYNLAAAAENFEKESCRLITLTDYDVLINRAVENRYVRDAELQSLIQWRENPKRWGEQFK